MIQISGYKDLHEIGRGSMGVVFRATHTVLGRTVALKVLEPSLVNEEDASVMFKGERAQAILSHPNVVSVLDAGHRDGHSFIAMEFVEGETLEDRLKSGPLATNESRLIARQILDGLAAAHEANIVHGDIKPANIIITPSGVVKIADFGLAQMRRRDGSETSTIETLGGSPRYLAPESLTYTDHRSDLYSLGLTLYEMIAGSLPFDVNADLGTVFNVKKNDLIQDLQGHSPAVPPDFGRAVMKSLMARPSDRFQSATEMRAALQEDRDHITTGTTNAPGKATGQATATPATASTGRTAAIRNWVASAAMVVAILAIAYYGFVKLSEGQSPVNTLKDTAESNRDSVAVASTEVPVARDNQPAVNLSNEPRRDASTQHGEQVEILPTGRLSLVAVPAGKLLLDDVEITSGSSEVAAGNRNIGCEQSGLRVDTTVVVSEGSEVAVTCYTQMIVNVSVRSGEGAPIWAAVWVDGENLATKTDHQFQLGVGEHEIFVRRSGYYATTNVSTLSVRPAFSQRVERLIFELRR